MSIGLDETRHFYRGFVTTMSQTVTDLPDWRKTPDGYHCSMSGGGVWRAVCNYRGKGPHTYLPGHYRTQTEAIQATWHHAKVKPPMLHLPDLHLNAEVMLRLQNLCASFLATHQDDVLAYVAMPLSPGVSRTFEMAGAALYLAGSSQGPGFQGDAPCCARLESAANARFPEGIHVNLGRDLLIHVSY